MKRVKHTADVPRKHPVPHHIARFILKPIFRVYFGMRAEGLENLPNAGPYIMAPNHVSMLDWAFISYFLPKLTRFVVHQEYYDNPVMGFGLRVNGSIPLRTDRADLTAMRALRKVLAAGEPIIMFPEGGISLDGRPQTFHPGVVRLAASASVSIVPVALRGAFEAFPRRQRVPRPGRVTVIFGKPLPPPATGGRDAHLQYAAALRARIADLLDGRPPQGASRAPA